ncbi:MAG: pantetheine-phosphate adenylyltransferase [Bacteroidales bacterium]|jgi:pantetheine-phosphate adenylyltransferase|nr:pantetheine-phosphate adenylyltransferase [Bacteroidales bacterium]
MMLKIAVFPGSFDPFTKGHQQIVEKMLALFDKIIVGVGENSGKNGLFSTEQRKKRIEEVFSEEPKVSVDIYSGLTVDFCRRKQVLYIVRGLRSFLDFEYEKEMALFNKNLAPEIETIFVLSAPELAHISSSNYREILNCCPEKAQEMLP